MKFVIALAFVAFISLLVHHVLSQHLPHRGKKKQHGHLPLLISLIVALILTGGVWCLAYQSDHAPDLQCTRPHEMATPRPVSRATAGDLFVMGNYDYDSGNCEAAIMDYTESLRLDPNNAQAYNNRAYTYMRMRQFPAALADLSLALTINPNYVQALMNRGDIHNFYYAIDRKSAIADYEKVLGLGGNPKTTSVCGHLFLARHDGWSLAAILSFPFAWGSCQ